MVTTISKLEFQDCILPGENHFNMHYDASDCLRQVGNQECLNEVRKSLMYEFGDVQVEVKFGGAWFDRVTILDDKWKEAHRKYCNAKAEWCSEYGCD